MRERVGGRTEEARVDGRADVWLGESCVGSYCCAQVLPESFFFFFKYCDSHSNRSPDGWPVTVQQC